MLDKIPPDAKLVEVTDGMTVKDFIAHRTEWGRMALSWHRSARAGIEPDVPASGFTWAQLKPLNAQILTRFADVPLEEAEAAFSEVNSQLAATIDGCSEEELFTVQYYSFTGTSDLATYLTSATGGHYRSAYKHINKWWRAHRDDWIS